MTDKNKIQLGSLFYPTQDKDGNKISFDNLFIPFIYKEIYLEGVYVDLMNNKQDLTILDIGANIGITVQYFREYAKKIYALEPSSEHFAALKKNKEFNNWDNVEIFDVALSDKDGEAMLSYNIANRTCNSITNDYGQGSEKVKTVAFDTFFKENKIDKIDFCKFDVEGAEDIILRSESFKKVADKISAIEVEFHHPNYPDLVKYMMEEFGFEARRYPSSAIIVLFSK